MDLKKEKNVTVEVTISYTTSSSYETTKKIVVSKKKSGELDLKEVKKNTLDLLRSSREDFVDEIDSKIDEEIEKIEKLKEGEE